MPADDLVVSKVMDVTVVDFKNSSILDSATVEDIGKALYRLVDELAIRKLMLDFSQVRFLSSQMIGALIALYKKSKAIKGKVVLCGLRPELYKVFKIMKLEKLMVFADTEEDALQKLDAYRKS